MCKSWLPQEQSNPNSHDQCTNTPLQNRRSVLRAVTISSAVVALLTLGSDVAQAEMDITPQSTRDDSPESETTITIAAVGSRAWEVTSIEGDAGEAAISEDNPEITLLTNTRYTFVNDGGRWHPLAFRDSDGEPLLTQSDTGSFENDEDVAWVDDGDQVSFTLTRSLSDAMAEYICTAHNLMNAPIATDFPPSTLSIESIDSPTSITADEAARINVVVEETGGNELVDAVATVRIEAADETIIYENDVSLEELEASRSQTFEVPSDLDDSNEMNTAPESGVRVEDDGLTFEVDSESTFTVFVEADAENAERVINSQILTISEATEPEADDTDMDNTETETDSDAETDRNDDTETETNSDAETNRNDDPTTVDETPGFGIGSALIALGAGAVAALRRIQYKS